MKLDNWPLDRIMRLPDWCFGRRYWVGTYSGNSNGTVDYRMSEEELPDKFVIWSVLISSREPSAAGALRVTLRLGNHIPTGVADALTMERLLKGVSRPDILYELYCMPNCLTYLHGLRMCVESAGRRICSVVNGDQQHPFEVTLGVLISAMPREVNEWLHSDSPSYQW